MSHECIIGDKTFKSVAEAAKYYGYNPKSIYSAARSKKQSPEDWLRDKVNSDVIVIQNGRRSEVIVNGQTYGSIKQACEATGCNYSSLYARKASTGKPIQELLKDALSSK